MRHVSLLASLLCIIPLYAAEDAKSATFQTSDGVTLHYFDAGNPANPALVFVPGWTMAADIFDPQIKGLSQRFHVVVLDPRSQGDSEKTSGNNTLERRSKDTLELLDHLSSSTLSSSAGQMASRTCSASSIKTAPPNSAASYL